MGNNVLLKVLADIPKVNVNDVGGNRTAEDVFRGVFNGVLGVIGMICVIVIIIGGIQYMTSTGDPGKVKKGKDTIMYGIIGLVIVAFSAVIVNFVISTINNSGNSNK